MAIVGNNEDDELKKIAPTTSSSPGATAALSLSQPGSINPAPVSNGIAGAPAAGGGGYSNLLSYLSANQESGDTTARGAENVVNQAAYNADLAQKDYQTSASNDIANAKALVGVNNTTMDKINAGAPVIKDYQDQIASGIYNPGFGVPDLSHIFDDPNNYTNEDLGKVVTEGSNAKTRESTGYNGPTDFAALNYTGPAKSAVGVSYGGPANTSGFSGKTATAQQNALDKNNIAAGKVANSQGGQTGISSLLRDAYQPSGQQYSHGENSLDAFLVGGGNDALALAPAVGDYVANSYSGINSALSGQIDDAKKVADQTNLTYSGAIDDATKRAGDALQVDTQAVADAKARTAANIKKSEDDAILAQAELDRRAALPNQTTTSDSMGAFLKQAQGQGSGAVDSGGGSPTTVHDSQNDWFKKLQDAEYGDQIRQDLTPIEKPPVVIQDPPRQPEKPKQVTSPSPLLGPKASSSPNNITSGSILQSIYDMKDQVSDSGKAAIGTANIAKAKATGRDLSGGVKSDLGIAADAYKGSDFSGVTNFLDSQAGKVTDQSHKVSNPIGNVVGSAVNVEKGAGGEAAKLAKKVVKPFEPILGDTDTFSRSLGFAHGGKVPSYSKLLDLLEGK